MPNDNNPDTSQNPPVDSDDNNSQPDLNTTINAAVTAHLRRFAKNDLSKMIADAINPLKDEFAKLQPSTQQPAGGKKTKDQDDPEMAALRAQFEELKLKNRQSEERAADLERKRRDDLTYGEIRNYVQKGGVKQELVGFVSDYLHKASGKIEYDDDGTPLFKARQAPAPGLSEEDILLPLSAGIEKFLKSPEAAAFLPAPAPTGTSGKTSMTGRSKTSSSGPPKYEHPASTEEERVRRAKEKADWIREHSTKQ